MTHRSITKWCSVVDFYNVVAQQKLSEHEDWRWCNLKYIGPDVLVEGGVPRTITRGKNKGKSSWRGVARTSCAVTSEELAAAKTAFEQSTKLCWSC